jgi:hypothetical protein
MLKKIVMASLTLATLMVGPSQAFGQMGGCQPKYLTRMFSDATYQVQVGYISGQCAYPHIRYYLVGEYTMFQTEEQDGDCGCGPIE